MSRLWCFEALSGFAFGVAAGLLLLLLAACAPSTAGGVRELGPDKQVSFIAPENYQPVYRKILGQAQKCMQSGLITAATVAEGELYTDTKIGTITVSLRGGLGAQVHLVVDVSAIDEQRTRVLISTAQSRPESYARPIRAWVLDGSKECDPSPK